MWVGSQKPLKATQECNDSMGILMRLQKTATTWDPPRQILSEKAMKNQFSRAVCWYSGGSLALGRRKVKARDIFLTVSQSLEERKAGPARSEQG